MIWVLVVLVGGNYISVSLWFDFGLFAVDSREFFPFFFAKIRVTPALHRTHEVPEVKRSGSAVQVFAARIPICA